MEYRFLGNTGLKVSVIGLGCEGFLNKSDAFTQELFDLALAQGINCMDLYSPDPDMHRRVGRCIANVREQFVLQGHLCTKWENGQYSATRDLDEVKHYFAQQLQNLGTNYLDIGMIHYVDSMETWNTVVDNGILDYAKELKASGAIRHIGLSSHNPIVALEAVKHGIEVLMFSVNPCYDLLPGGEDCEQLFQAESYQQPLLNLDPVREELYETCQRLGVGITVMKAFGGGDLLSADSPAGKALTPAQCIHYALTRPAVATVLSGVRSLDDLKRSLAYCDATAEEKDYAAAFASFPKISWQGHCMYCGHCAPCPKGIEVANVTKFLNLCKAQKQVPETVREHYAALSAHASDCISCGACQKRCPFGVDIKSNLRSAKEIFGY